MIVTSPFRAQAKIEPGITTIDVMGDDPFTWTPDYPAFYLAVIGSRRRTADDDRDQVLVYVARYVDEAEARGERVVIVSGGASRGADRNVEHVAAAIGLDVVRFRPRIVPDGSPYYVAVRALFDRNTRVVELAHAVGVQVHPDGKGGTEDAVKKAHRLGRPVELLLQDGTIVVESIDDHRARMKGAR